ncbi:hypothetical protein LRR81_01640 [Metabacillus sp. GX 13764]|uniref:hypothetical protein n=1 Tax=Metabacillus kandeliae TaxID=2900151 RepID=UPI001E40F3B4|nr:hypothetical protein [Metabacillus kandeliae]MCD7032914.1 hypothetical protein [Metabacillus kandeliae]
MLPNINLLPEKKQKNYTSLLLLGMIVVLLAGSFVFLNTQLEAKRTDLRTMKTKDIALQNQLSAVQQASSVSSNPTAAQTLADAVTWTKTYPVEFVPILMDLTKLLPEGGYFTDFSYTEADKIEVSIQFETSREAAFYLNRLKTDIPYFQEAALKKVEEQELKDNSEANVLPRYKADYSIELNRAKWKELQKKGDKE